MKKIKVEGMMCEHCVKAVTNALSNLEGSGKIDVSLKEGEVTVEGNPVSEEIKKAIENEGYTVLSIEDVEDGTSSDPEKKEGFFSKLFKKIATSNKKEFGDEKMDCCKMKKD